MQIGYSKPLWPVVLVKELIDNALDACESADIQPHIIVKVEPDAVSVQDNGPGLSLKTIQDSLDYLERVSDKAHYASPTRGQLGNALKCVWAAPYVADGSRGLVEVLTGGQTHRIDVTLDRIGQKPDIKLDSKKGGFVKNGTLVRIHWSEIASLLEDQYWLDSYISPDVFRLICDYAIFNPHALIELVTDSEIEFRRTNHAWHKWKPNNQTSPHWYTLEGIKSLIAAYMRNDDATGKTRTVREFVSEFAGLSGTAKQKAVTEVSGLIGAYLRDLVEDGDISTGKANSLLWAMKDHSREIKPPALGVIGQAHMTARMIGEGVSLDSIQYRKVEGVSVGVPFVLEVAFGIYEDDEDRRRAIVAGLNWSPVMKSPLERLSNLLGEMRIDEFDPVLLIVHLTCPRLEFTDRGKSSLVATYEVIEALNKCVRAVAARWKQAKRQADRNDRISRAELESQRRANRSKEITLKDAAYQVMEAAYLDASAGGTLPANARQIMYSARPLVLKLTGGKLWKKSSTFTQQYLVDFIEANPKLTASWDVVFDARGQFVEPHTKKRVELGTLAVRGYVGDWHDGFQTVPMPILERLCPTTGPANRYRHVLFVEKEGFNELWKAVNLADRFDLAIMSTKGMSVTAVRRLVEKLSEQGVTIFVLRDFDKSGFSIVHTLRSDTRRYQFKSTPNVIDLGVRLADVVELGLQSEQVTYKSKKGKTVDPRENLRARGASEDECAFLVRGGSERAGWHGERVELNALGPARLVEWLERKLIAAGVGKFIPSSDVLADAYRRALSVAELQRLIDEERKKNRSESKVPAGLLKKVQSCLKDSRLSWDEAIYDIARKALEKK